jgi:arylsulfatase A-like enzyme
MAAVSLSVAELPARASEAGRPNVLMIAVDDLNDWVGCLGGHPQVKTPNIDRLARRGTVFTNAHCQSPLCNPSRTSFLTGRRPSSTGVYGLQPGFRKVEALKDVVTVFQHFAVQGYETFCAGKVFHDGSVPPADRAREVHAWGDPGRVAFPKEKFVHTPQDIPAMDWGVFPERDEDQADWNIADSAIARLKSAPAERPFFIAAGFRLPHVPLFATGRWFDLYPEASLVLPRVRQDDRDDVPPFAWYLHWSLPEPRLAWLESSGQWRPLVRSYLAGVSFMDSQVGRVLDALESTGRSGSTVIVLLSDHGWHLGEKGVTGKNTLWERSTRVPLIVAGPGVTAGARCSKPAELLDLYPTLVELCGLPPRDGLEGHSLGPQLRDASAERSWPALTTHNPGNHAVRDERWRYVRYADGSEELYDHEADPEEWVNLAGGGRHEDVIRRLRGSLPRADAPHVPGNAGRVLEKRGGTWYWEGRPVGEIERSP